MSQVNCNKTNISNVKVKQVFENNVLYLNSESLIAHVDEIRQLVIELKPIVLCLSETRITEDILDCEIDIENYNIYRCNSLSRYTGGVIIYVVNTLNSSPTENVIFESNYWYLQIKIKIFQETVFIGCIYHSPNASHVQFCDFFENLVERLDFSQLYIFIGDFNIRWDIIDDTYSKRLHNISRHFGLKQFISQPTRITDTTSSIIDLLFTNCYEIQVNMQIAPKITDHEIIGINLNCHHPVSDLDLKFRILDYNKISLSLIDANWLYGCTNTNNVFESFINNIKIALDKECPVIKKQAKKYNEWFNDTIKETIRNRDLAYKQFKINKNGENWRTYTSNRNEVVKVLRKEKQNYYENKIDNLKHNPKLMWRTLKNIIKPKANHNISSLIIGGVEKNEHLEEELNIYFISSVDLIVDGLKNNSYHPNRNALFENRALQPGIYFREFNIINLTKLRKIVFKQQNKFSDDEIDFKLIKNTFDIIGYPLLHIINTSLNSGKFPEILKTSLITPVAKVPGTRLAEEHRPINTLPALEKILEIVVHDQLTEFINNNKLLHENQSGFRENHSCETALQKIINDFKYSIDKGEVVITVFLDLKRAFEVVNREFLLKKLCQYFGIVDTAYEWFKSYLYGRSQQTKINKIKSEKLCNNNGVPQGSVLGPMLFTLFINDIFQVNSEGCKMHLFADDTIIYLSGTNVKQVIQKINITLELINEWFTTNGLMVNAKKSKYMIIGSNKYLNQNIDMCVKYSGEHLEKVVTMKYLGIIIDNKLTFNDHINYICKKISKKLGFAYRVSKHLTLNTRKTIYNTIIKPHFEYCSSILYMCNDTNISKLQLLQNRCMRFILKYNRYANINIMQCTLNWFSVKDNIKYRTLIFLYKLHNNLLPTYLSANIQHRRDIHNYNTRQRNHININFSNLMKTKSSIYDKGAAEFNKLPEFIKQAKNVVLFKKYLYKFMYK